MNSSLVIRVFTILFFTIIIQFFSKEETVSAQEWEIGGWMGASHYFGDLNTNTSLERMHPAGGILLRYNITDRFVWKNTISAARVSFADELSPNVYQQARNLSFYSNIFEFSTQLEINFFSFDRYRENKRFTPYLLVGLSGFYFNPKARLDDEVYVLHDFRTEDERYIRFALSIPIGGGFKYAVNDFWTLGVEVANRKAFTDYLDDVSDVYSTNIEGTGITAALADRSGEVGDKIGTPGKQRGNANKNDNYLFMGVWVSYTIRTMKCPKPGNKF